MRWAIKLTLLALLAICAVVGLLLFMPVSFAFQLDNEEPKTLEAAQKIYQKKCWYWAAAKWTPISLPEFEIHSGKQIILCSTNKSHHTLIIYSELTPRRGLFAQRGINQLKQSAFLNPPLFEVDLQNQADETNRLMIVGILKNRLFYIEADGESRADAYSNACLVASSALKQLQTN